MAGALGRLHAADILHRDVKPSNIGFTRDGVPKLMDFGIARMVLDSRTEASSSPPTGSKDVLEMDDDQVATWVWGAPGDPKTRAGQLVGTLAYLSPEALEGAPPAASFDLWGLAVVLYECLIGRKLFRGDEVKQVMARIVNGRVPELTDVREDAPEPLARFFRTALHRDIDRRPASAAAMRQRLQEVRAALGDGV
jgi:serine/threonine-protein kinase